MIMKWCVVVLSLCAVSIVCLPVKKDAEEGGGRRHALPKPPPLPGVDLDEYKRYLDELVESDPSKYP